MNFQSANAQVSLAEALDQPGLVFTTGGGAPWQGLATPDAPWDGVDAAVASPLGETSGYLTTTVTGPARLRFTLDRSLPATFLVSGSPVQVNSGTNTLSVGSGEHTLTWWAYGPGNPTATGAVFLDNIVIESLPSVDAAVLLERPGATAGHGSSAVAGDESRDGKGAVRMIPGIGEPMAWIAAPVTGLSRVTAWLRTDAGVIVDLMKAMTVLVDGQKIPFSIGNPGEGGWRRLTAWQVRPETVNVRIETTTELVADNWEALPVASVSPGVAADAAGVLTFSDITGATGIQRPGNDATGGQAIVVRCSPDTPAGFSTTVTGPTTLGMWTLSHGPHFSVNHSISGVIGGGSSSYTPPRRSDEGRWWYHSSFRIPAGQQTLVWSFQPGFSAPSGDLWIDEITVTPEIPVTLAEALDLPGATVTAGPPEAWQAILSPSFVYLEGDDDLAIVTPGAGMAWLEVPFAGPAWVQPTVPFSSSKRRMLLDGQLLTGPWVETAAAPGGGPHVLRLELTESARIPRLVIFSQPRAVSLDAVTPLPLRLYSGNSADVWQALEFPPSTEAWVPGGVSLINYRGQLSPAHSRLSVETTLPGPGVISYKAYRNSVSIDGNVVHPLGRRPWRGIAVSGAGPHTVRWEWDATPGVPDLLTSYTAAVPHFDFIPATESLEAAFGVAGVVLTSGGDRQWSTMPPADDATGPGNVLACPMLIAGERSWLEAALTGPGRLDFSWLPQHWQGTTWVDLDGSPVFVGKNSYAWECLSLFVPAGQHRVRWITLESSSTIPMEREPLPLLLAAVRFTPQAAAPSTDPSLQESLDIEPSIAFTTGGAVTTVRGTGIGHNDAVSITSGALHSPSFIETTIEGPARVGFDVRGAVQLRANGVLIQSGWGHPWHPIVFDLGPGSHAVRWEAPPPPYPPSGAYLSQLSASCLLDHLTINEPPPTDVPPGEAVDFPLAFGTPPGPDFRGQGEITWDGVDALLVNSWQLGFWVQGPGMLTFRQFNVAQNMNPVVDLEPPDVNGWQLRGRELQPGWNAISLGFTRHDQQAPAFFDSFQLLPPQASSLGAAVEAENLQWTTRADLPWEAVSVPGFSGDLADAAGSPMTYEQSWIETIVHGPGVLRFSLQVPHFPEWIVPQSYYLVRVTVDREPWDPVIARQPQHNAIRIESPGPHHVRWMTAPFSSFESLIRLDRVSFTPLSGIDSYAVWRAVHGLPGTQGGPEDDDADDLGPLVEYAFGLDAQTADNLSSAVRLPVSALTSAGGENYLTLTYHRRRTDPGLQYIPEFGSDAQTFTAAPGGASVTPLDSFWEEVTVTDSVPVSASSRRFGRVRIAWEAMQGEE